MADAKNVPGWSAERYVHAWLPDGRVLCATPFDLGFAGQPCTRPDGEALVFWGAPFGDRPGVWLWELDHGCAERITPAGQGWLMPTYSWDRSRIVFSGGATGTIERDFDRWSGVLDGPLDLFSLDTSTGAITQITHSPSRDERAAFSPDATRVVFVSDRTGSRALWTVASDGSSEPQLLHPEPSAYRPWYSADGAAVFFFQEIGDGHQICRIATDSSSFAPLENDDRGNSHGPWADPSGKTLLMHSDRGGQSAIYELPLDGSEPVRLSPPGFLQAGHATRGQNGLIAFDTPQAAPAAGSANM